MILDPACRNGWLPVQDSGLSHRRLNRIDAYALFSFKSGKTGANRQPRLDTGLAQSRADEHGVRLTNELDPTTGEFEADPRAVRSLLVNLVENSLDACRADTTKEKHAVQFSVRRTHPWMIFE